MCKLMEQLLEYWTTQDKQLPEEGREVINVT